MRSEPLYLVDSRLLSRILAAVAQMPPARAARWCTALARILAASPVDALALGSPTRGSDLPCHDPTPGEGTGRPPEGAPAARAAR